MTSQEAVGKMRTDSDHFFKYYPVKMFGGAAPWVGNAENIKAYRLRRDAAVLDDDGDVVTKAGHKGATRPGKIFSCITHNISSFQMWPDNAVVQNMAGQNSNSVNTCGVPMVNFNSNEYGGINLHGNIVGMDYDVAGGGANFMTTGQLSGCCFAWCEVGGNLRCAHVLPSGNLPAGGAITGQVLQQNMTATGRFHGMPGQALETFGFLQYGVRRASVIGVKVAGTWRIYAQISGDGFRTINEAWQLHPGPRRQIR